MLSSNNILSPAHGRPIAVPTQDMILGCYYLTYFDGPDLDKIDAYDPEVLAALDRPLRYASEVRRPGAGLRRRACRACRTRCASSGTVLRSAHHRGAGLLQLGRGGRPQRSTSARLWDEEGPDGEPPRKHEYEFRNRVFTKKVMSDFVSDLVEYFGATAVAHLLDVLKDLGFHYATRGRGHHLQERHRDPARQGGDPRRATTSRCRQIQKEYRPGHHDRERAPRAGHRPVDRSHRHGGRGHGAELPLAQPGAHDGRLRSPGLLAADPAAGRHARSHGQSEGRDHRAAHQVELHGRPLGARVLHLHARRPQGSGRHRPAHGRLRVPHPAPGRRGPGRGHPRRGLRHPGLDPTAAAQGRPHQRASARPPLRRDHRRSGPPAR